MGTGQANVKEYVEQLCDLIIVGRAEPSLLVSKVLPLEGAADGYSKSLSSRTAEITLDRVRIPFHTISHQQKEAQPS